MADLTKSSYLDYLPAIFHEAPFLGRFLLPFERVLSEAAPEDEHTALETIIEQSHTYFKPTFSGNDTSIAPAEFLPWLASWVALTLREDLSIEKQREFIRNIVPLYKLRGTKLGLQKILQIYLGDDVPITIYDDAEDFGFEPPPHYFQVAITVKDSDPDELRRKQIITSAIIEQEKPAHTYYGIQIRFPGLQLLSHPLADDLEKSVLYLGHNTLLGTGIMGNQGEGA